MDPRRHERGEALEHFETSDVVRRQSDGRWLVAIDSPFGAAGVP